MGYIDDYVFDTSIFNLFFNVPSVTTLIVKELLYINKIIFLLLFQKVF